jgi:hypothetical protein
MRFDAALAVRQGGTLRAAGSVARDFSAADGTLAAEGVNLAPLAPLVARYAAVDLASGRGSAAARLRFAANASPRLTARGTFAVDDLLVNEDGTGERLLAWESLAAEDVELALAPGLLSIGQIRVQAPGAKIDIDEARRLNLTQLLRREAKAGDRPRGAPAEERFPVRIARVALRGGTVDFSDRSLALPFATRVQRLNGTILGIASDRASRAELRLSGLVQDSGSARAEGAIQPSDPAAFTDIRAVFNNVAVPPLSPYSVTFAGRKVESGRLWLDLHYRVVDGRLSARNQIALDDFRLGERVASRRALDLPLDLAVTLLRDDRGRIRVAVPIEGDVRSPRFDYGRLVREALARLVTRVVTAPFRFLAGGGGAELEAVHFEPGRARLAPPEREILDRVAKTLAERPELKLVVRGPYDPQRDGEALRELAVRRELAAALRTKPAERDGPVPVAYGDAATQRALEQLLAARAGDDAIDRLAGQHKQSTGGAAQRVNPVFAVFGRASPDRELYEAVFRRLVELQPLDDDGLQALAVRRAEAITAYLVQSGRLAAARIENGAVQAVDAGSEPSIEAELGLGLERRPS